MSGYYNNILILSALSYMYPGKAHLSLDRAGWKPRTDLLWSQHVTDQ